MTPINLTSAFFVTQISMLGVIFLGLLILRKGESRFSPYSDNPRLATTDLPIWLVGFALLTTSCLAFSNEFVFFSRPMFGDVPLPSLSQSAAFLAVFIANILFSGFLIFHTGGSQNSPFSAVLLLLPAVSIFLREPPLRLLTYTLLTATVFIFTTATGTHERYNNENKKQRLAFNFVTLGCLSISTLLGYATRPI